MLAKVDLVNCRYVQGENADQLFGSDLIFSVPTDILMHQEFNADTLAEFLRGKLEGDAFNQQGYDKLHTEFMLLASKSPLRIEYMRDFLWWLNFTCKWQGVALRTLNFANVFENEARLTRADISAFDTFYNTKAFQELAISGSLKRFGEQPSPHNYKQSAREFIAEEPNLRDYAATKIKVGSLYNVIRQRAYVNQALALDDKGYLFSTTLS